MEAASGRIYVVGDIHGCVDELNVMLDAIAPGTNDTVCFLGDYIDRGPSPRAVIDRLLKFVAEGARCVFLKGNHEDMFLAYLGFPGHYGEAFLQNGGGVTLRAYGIEGLSGPSAAEKLPPEHLSFFQSLSMRQTFGEFLCVHAGVRPARSLEEQTEEDLLWIREDFLNHPHPFGCTVLYGHTPRREVVLQLPYKIGLDTGVVYGNKLSCLELRDKQLLQVPRAARTVLRADLGDLFSRSARPA